MFSLINLPNSQPGEKAIVFLRRHILVFFIKIFHFILLLIFPVSIYMFVEFSFPGAFSLLLARPLLYPFVITVSAIYYLSIWLFLYFAFIDYYLDVWIVTNQRIINIEQHGLFNRVISEQKLFRVQDVTSEIVGVIPTFFNYGTVHIQTAGKEKRFIFKQVPFPYQVREKIINLVEAYRREHPKEMIK